MEQGDRQYRILEAALTVFSEKGYAATRIDDIAATAKVAKGLVYFYFENKQMLFEALIRLYMESLASCFTLPAYPAESMASRLAALLEQFSCLVRDDDTTARVVRLLFLEQHNFPEAYQVLQENMIAPLLQNMGDILEEGIRRGEWKKEYIPQQLEIFLAPVLLNLSVLGDALLEAKAAQDHQLCVLRSLGLTSDEAKKAVYRSQTMMEALLPQTNIIPFTAAPQTSGATETITKQESRTARQTKRLQRIRKNRSRS